LNVKNYVSLEFHRKYRVNNLEKQQKMGKICFFIEKILLNACFCAEKRFFFVILRAEKASLRAV